MEIEMEIFQTLIKARCICTEAFKLIRLLPIEEKYGLRSQMSRAAISVVSNIAEGNQRKGKDRFHLFLIAKGSLSELEEQLWIVDSVFGLEVSGELFHEIDELHRMLYALSQSHSQSPSQP